MHADQANRLPLLECTVIFLRPDEGGRRTPLPAGALSGDTYRPHIVVGDPKQRHAVSDECGLNAEEYIGVAFHEGPPQALAGTEMTVVLTAMYHPHPMYEKLVPGTTFTLREGRLITGYGEVRRWLDDIRTAKQKSGAG